MAALEEMNEVRTTEEAARLDQRLVDRFRGQQGLDDLRNSLAKHCDALKAVRVDGN